MQMGTFSVRTTGKVKMLIGMLTKLLETGVCALFDREILKSLISFLFSSSDHSSAEKFSQARHLRSLPGVVKF